LLIVKQFFCIDIYPTKGLFTKCHAQRNAFDFKRFQAFSAFDTVGFIKQYSLKGKDMQKITPFLWFNLTVKSRVRLVLMNVLGKVVQEIATAEYNAGYHEISFDAGNLAAGLYFYRIEAGVFMP
jgi:hypothetical protein